MDISKWRSRPKSAIVKTLMCTSNLSREDTANVIGCSVKYFDNKLTRNSFSLEDICKIAKKSGFSLVLVSDDYDTAIDISDFY